MQYKDVYNQASTKSSCFDRQCVSLPVLLRDTIDEFDCISNCDSNNHVAKSGCRYGVGFTLVEVLVVIAIFVALIMLLLPVFSKHRENARVAVCASNMHQWSLGMLSYRTDNRQKILSTTQMMPNARYPSYASMNVTSSGELDTKQLATYVPGGSTSNALDYSGIWRCPSAPSDGTDLYSKSGGAVGEAFLAFDYSYFAHVGEWTAQATLPSKLIDNSLASNRVWMADRVFRSGFLSTWSYNHGPAGPSWAWPDKGSAVSLGGIPRLSGANQMYGDGHVLWKSASLFDPVAMEGRDATRGYVRGAFGDATFY